MRRELNHLPIKSGLNVKGGNSGGHEGMKAPHTTEKAVPDPPK